MIIPFKGLAIGIAGLGLGFGAGNLFHVVRERYSKDNNEYNYTEDLEDEDFVRGKSFGYEYTIGHITALYTTNNQWRFLYHLATKVFNYLKNHQSSKNNKDIGASKHSSVISWLGEKFYNTNPEGSSDWQRFKRLCTKEIKRENSIEEFIVSGVPETRLCFIASSSGKPESWDGELYSHIELQIKSASQKANLWDLKNYTDSNKQKPYNLPAFQYGSWEKNNYQLWSDFKESEYGELILETDEPTDQEFKTAFNNWYDSDDTYITIRKNGNNKKLKDVLNPN